MSTDAKPYTTTEVRAWPARVIATDNFRMFATVEALERVTKERDEARADSVRARKSCAVETIKSGHGCKACPSCYTSAAVDARTSSVNAKRAEAERDAALAACGEMRELLRRALPSVQFAALLPLADEINKALASTAGRGWVSPEEHQGALAEIGARYAEKEHYRERAITAEAKLIGSVSPEAFDAALREVAADVGATGRLVVPKRQLDAIIAAAKAKHGGGR